MKITDEMIEAGAEAIHTTFSERPLKEALQCNQEYLREQSRLCLEAALQTKLTEQDKLIEVMVAGLEKIVCEGTEVVDGGFEVDGVANIALELLAKYKAGRE